MRPTVNYRVSSTARRSCANALIPNLTPSLAELPLVLRLALQNRPLRFAQTSSVADIPT
jgi:hypothetical protein